MISYNGQAAFDPASIWTMRRNFRRVLHLKFMMPAIDAAARGAIDLAVLTEADTDCGSPLGLPLLTVISAITPEGRTPLMPSAWTAMRRCRSTPPALVIDTLLVQAAWTAIVAEMVALGSVVIVLCEPRRAPDWLEAFKDIAPK